MKETQKIIEIFDWLENRADGPYMNSVVTVSRIQEAKLMVLRLLVSENDQVKRCPACLGTGSLDAPRTTRKKTDAARFVAKKMRAEGYSIREIMRALGYKSPDSICKFLAN